MENIRISPLRTDREGTYRMKKAERIESWKKNLSVHRKRFDRCIDFLQTNTKTVKQFHHRALFKLLSRDKAAKHRLYFLFIDSLEAAGGNNLTASAKASEKFLKTLEKFRRDKTISFKRFAKEIRAKTESTEGVFNILAKGKFKNFREKKAALFMRDIALCQSDKSLRIFNDLKSSDVHQPIPLDVVIADLCSKLLGLKKHQRIKAGRDFYDFNKWACDILGQKYYLFEDLWFWGYFTTRVDGKNSRKIVLNDDKLKTNHWFYPKRDDVFIEKLNEFCRLFKRRNPTHKREKILLLGA